MSINKPFRAVPITLGKRYRWKVRRQRLKRFALPVVILLGSAGIGGVAGVKSAIHSANTSSSDPQVSGCRVTDGDTIRCGLERIRFLGIDAPELPGHCRTGRNCALGDPYASTASLKEAMTGAIRIERFGIDRYGRTLGSVTSDHGNLSCWQLNHGQAVYRAAWDDDRRIYQTCPNAAQ